MSTLVLDSVLKSIQVTMSVAPATTNPDFTVAYADNNSTVFIEGANDGTLAGANDVVIAAAPASGYRRIIKSIFIENKDSAPVTITVKYDNNGLQRTIVKVTLNINDTWSTDGTYDTSGSLKQTLGTVNVSSVSGILDVGNGGTNISSYAVGDILYASGTSTLSKLADAATGNALLSGGVNTAPAYGKIGLSSAVSGNLPVTNLDSGTSASATTYWRGDGSWSTPAGAGSVTSVAATVPSVLSISGSPITSSGTLAITYSGTALPIANGGSGATTAQTGMNAFAGAVTAGSYLRGNATNVVMSTIQASDVPTLNQNTSGTAAGLSSTLAIASGGTSATTAGGALTALGAYPAANPSGFTNNTGTVTSVDASVPSVLSISGGPITGTGILAITYSGTALPIANGGSGATTAQASMNAFAGGVTSGSYLRGTGTNVVLSTIQVADVPTLNQNTSGTALNVTGTVAVLNGGTGATNDSVARTNLGLGTIATQASSSVTITGGSITGITDLAIADGGTGASTASDARSNLGLGSAATQTAGAANGVATLDSSGTVPLTQIPSSLQGGVSYQGAWNASTNTPTLVSSTGTKGFYYVVSVAGATNLNGITDWVTGDWAIFNGSIWQKIDNTDSVTSVNGFTGIVSLTAANVSAAPTSLTISAGTGLSGGGDLTTNRTLAIANTTVTAASYGSASSVGTFTVNGQGQLTTAASTTIAIANTQVSGLGTMSTQGASAVSISGGTITGITDLAIADGGTGASTAQTAINALAGSVTSGSYLRGNGSNILVGTIQAADVPTLNQNTSGTAGGLSATLAIASGGTASTTAAGALTSLGAYAANNPSGFTSNTGTVTSVGGTGTVSGLTLTGTVTTSGSLTLGGTLSVTNANTTATNLNTASAIVARDASGNFTAGTITAALTGNASTATSATTAGTITSQANSATITAATANTASTIVLRDSSGIASLNINGTVGATTPSTGVFTTLADSSGDVRTIVQNSQSGTYTLVAADNGKHITTASGVTVPASIFTVGQVVTIYNNSGSAITITTSAVTCYLAGTATTGARTLAQHGIATLMCVASNTFVVSGGGLT